MKNLLLKLFFWYYRDAQYEKPLSKIQQKILIEKLANTQGLEAFPIFLEQCITNARNKYLYSNDPVFKGSIMAYQFLKSEIEANKAKPMKKDLTQEEKVGIMRKRGY